MHVGDAWMMMVMHSVYMDRSGRGVPAADVVTGVPVSIVICPSSHQAPFHITLVHVTLHRHNVAIASPPSRCRFSAMSPVWVVYNVLSFW